MIGCPRQRGSLGSYGYILQLEGPDTSKDIINKPATLGEDVAILSVVITLFPTFLRENQREQVRPP